MFETLVGWASVDLDMVGCRLVDIAGWAHFRYALNSRLDI
jgi:hypothetical protein